MHCGFAVREDPVLELLVLTNSSGSELARDVPLDSLVKVVQISFQQVQLAANVHAATRRPVGQYGISVDAGDLGIAQNTASLRPGQAEDVSAILGDHGHHIRIGGDRDNIVQVIGAPYITTRNEDGTCKDVYKIVEDAPTKGEKTVAVVGHAAMDVVTLGLWEIAGTPLELATQKEATTFILYYGPDNKLKAYDAIK